MKKIILIVAIVVGLAYVAGTTKITTAEIKREVGIRLAEMGYSEKEFKAQKGIYPTQTFFCPK